MKKIKVTASVETNVLNKDLKFIRQKLGVDLITTISKTMIDEGLIQFTENIHFINHIQNNVFGASVIIISHEDYDIITEIVSGLKILNLEPQIMDKITAIEAILTIQKLKRIDKPTNILTPNIDINTQKTE